MSLQAKCLLIVFFFFPCLLGFILTTCLKFPKCPYLVDELGAKYLLGGGATAGGAEGLN